MTKGHTVDTLVVLNSMCREAFMTLVFANRIMNSNHSDIVQETINRLNDLVIEFLSMSCARIARSGRK